MKHFPGNLTDEQKKQNNIDLDEIRRIGKENVGLGIELGLQEKTRAAAAPRKPKNGAVSSPLNEDILDRGSATTSLGSESFC
jgi:hypothetical protein